LKTFIPSLIAFILYILIEMKKTMYGLLLGFVALFGVATVVPALAQGGAGGEPDYSSFGNSTTSFNDSVKTNTSGIGVSGAGENKGAGIIDVIKRALNWGLSILGFVALVLCLYGGFIITTAAGDDGKVKKGRTILTQAGIGLAVIALSALIVNLIFYVIG
jgi:hypothetical protein